MAEARPMVLLRYRPGVAGAPATPPPVDDTRPLAAAAGYRLWGWPVTLCGDQVWLNLEPNTVALPWPSGVHRAT